MVARKYLYLYFVLLILYHLNYFTLFICSYCIYFRYYRVVIRRKTLIRVLNPFLKPYWHLLVYNLSQCSFFQCRYISYSITFIRGISIVIGRTWFKLVMNIFWSLLMYIYQVYNVLQYYLDNYLVISLHVHIKFMNFTFPVLYWLFKLLYLLFVRF